MRAFPRRRPLLAVRLPGLCLGLGLLAALPGCGANVSPEFYARKAADLQAHGRLRTDRAPVDVRYDARDLAEAFREIAFSFEFQYRDGRIVAKAMEKPLQRWQGRIRYRVTGDGATPADRAEIAGLMQDIAGLTGLAFEASEDAHDMLISIASRAGTDAVSATLAANGQDVHRQRYDLWRSRGNWPCGADLSKRDDGSELLVWAHVYVAAEVTGLMRRACLHEEIAQSLGLTNDSYRARPSIFNDDQEFALLTDHDRALLRLLYDPRLTPGMSRDEAMPIVHEIAAEQVRPAAREHAALSPPRRSSAARH